MHKLPACAGIDELHERFHATAKKALQAHEAKDPNAAFDVLTEMCGVSSELLDKLEALSAALHPGAPPEEQKIAAE